MGIARKELKNESFKGIATGNKLAAVNDCLGLFDTCPRDTKVRRMRQA